MTACTLERNWQPYIIASVVTFFGGLILLFPFRLAWILCRDKRKEALKGFRETQNCLSSIRTYAENVLSGNTLFSKSAVIVFWIVDIAVIVVYLTEANLFDPDNPDDCGSVLNDRLQMFWMSLMAANTIRFIIKFLAAHDKCLMWMDLYSVVDHLTIVPTFVGAVLDRNWLALRFLVVIRILKIPDTLQIIHILRDRNQIRIAKAISAVLTVWFLGTGMIFILENNGDPFKDYTNRQQLMYGECFYFILITLTTIGYGDIGPKTVLGRIFIVGLVVFALAMFGSLIPELGKAVASRDKYRNGYKRSYNRRHVVICGGITFETISTVVRNFIHKDAAVQDVDIVIVDKDKPSSELQAFFRRHFNDVTFIHGSVIDIPTLQLAKVGQAAAVFILANRQTRDTDEEDSANIMRATAVKNLSGDIRIIIQLLRHQNKEQLLNIPGWNWQKQDGDEVICISELQMALMAQNCLAPGIVTMFSNLICMRSSNSMKRIQSIEGYNYGAGHEFYSEIFNTGNGLIGLTFAEAAEICFKMFNVLLVAIECEDGRGRTKLKVNPGRRIVLAPGHIGFFIAQDPSEIKRVASYHQCDKRGLQNEMVPLAVEDVPKIHEEPSSPIEDLFEYVDETTSLVNRNSFASTKHEEATAMSNLFDVSGMFHWCLAKPIESVILDGESLKECDFNNHVIFILRCDSDSSIDGDDTSSRHDFGLYNFVSPLRSSSLPSAGLQDIIFYTDVGAVKAEWKNLAHFPRLFVYQKTRALHSDLRSLNIHKCAMCIVTSTSGASVIDNAVVDKRTVLTTMNILSLQKLEEKINSLGVLTNPEIFRKQIAVTRDFPLLAQLESEASVPYIDDDDDDDPSVPLYLTMPYVCGRILLASVLDSAVSAAFMNGKVLRLIRALMTGGEISDLESIMADGVGIVRSSTQLPDYFRHKRRSSLSLFSLNHGPLETFQSCTEYGDLLVKSLRTYGLLCLGIYRLLQKDSKDLSRQKRYVITSPPYAFKLLLSDKIYVLKPYELGATEA